MCMECRQNHCDCRCPNAEPEKSIHKCKDCGFGIYKGDEFVEIEGNYYHLDCIGDMEIDELLKLFDKKVFIA